MPGIMIDIRDRRRTPQIKPNRYVIHRCTYCDRDRWPIGKPIDPTTDKQAIQMKDGTFKCGVCIGEDVKKSLTLFGGKKDV
jgi:hypothetical protein